MSPPPSTPTARKAPPTLRGTDKRDAIVDAAIDLFVERGFHGTAVPEVADRAGVGAGTIYRYFTSKESLVNEIYQQFKTELTGRVMNGFPVDKPARQMIHHMWTALAEFAKEKPRAYAFLELHHHGSYLDAQSNAIESRIMDMGVRFLTAAQERGEVKPYPPMLLIAIVHGAFIGMLRKCWEGLLELTPETIAAGETCAWEAIRA
jgi:TetR/AcrR family transcriptional regulator, repressor of fatR-cypB operon